VDEQGFDVPEYLDEPQEQNADASAKRSNKDSEDRYHQRLKSIKEEFCELVDEHIGKDACEGIRKGSRGFQERLRDAIKLFK
jgi:hypothetical protein